MTNHAWLLLGLYLAILLLLVKPLDIAHVMELAARKALPAR
jgi:hypothetical protein